jgi:hypothetical protein
MFVGRIVKCIFIILVGLYYLPTIACLVQTAFKRYDDWLHTANNSEELNPIRRQEFLAFFLAD